MTTEPRKQGAFPSKWQIRCAISGHFQVTAARQGRWIHHDDQHRASTCSRMTSLPGRSWTLVSCTGILIFCCTHLFVSHNSPKKHTFITTTACTCNLTVLPPEHKILETNKPSSLHRIRGTAAMKVQQQKRTTKEGRAIHKAKLSKEQLHAMTTAAWIIKKAASAKNKLHSVLSKFQEMRTVALLDAGCFPSYSQTQWLRLPCVNIF